VDSPGGEEQPQQPEAVPAEGLEQLQHARVVGAGLSGEGLSDLVR
jgi:hypothetical protein